MVGHRHHYDKMMFKMMFKNNTEEMNIVFSELTSGDVLGWDRITCSATDSPLTCSYSEMQQWPFLMYVFGHYHVERVPGDSGSREMVTVLWSAIPKHLQHSDNHTEEYWHHHALWVSCIFHCTFIAISSKKMHQCLVRLKAWNPNIHFDQYDPWQMLNRHFCAWAFIVAYLMEHTPACHLSWNSCPSLAF